jgi:hypothetical protein
MNSGPRASLSATQIRIVRFQHYLTKNFPITSAMSYAIGEYVLDNLITPESSMGGGLRKAPARHGVGLNSTTG